MSEMENAVGGPSKMKPDEVVNGQRRYSLRLLRLMATADSMPVEFFGGMFGVLWGGWLLNPYEATFSMQAYSRLAEMAPEWVWGGIMLALSLWQWVALFTGLRSRYVASLLLLFAWSAVAGAFIAGHEPRLLASVLYPGFAAMQAWAFLRLESHRRAVHRAKEAITHG